MTQISDAESIFGSIAQPLSAQELKALTALKKDWLVCEVDWQKRQVKCLVERKRSTSLQS